MRKYFSKTKKYQFFLTLDANSLTDYHYYPTPLFRKNMI